VVGYDGIMLPTNKLLVYNRVTDPAMGKVIQITSITGNTLFLDIKMSTNIFLKYDKDLPFLLIKEKFLEILQTRLDKKGQAPKMSTNIEDDGILLYAANMIILGWISRILAYGRK
jgi:hypothetical protein